METVEEEQLNQGIKPSDHQDVANSCHIVKGRRTKRLRQPHNDVINHHLDANTAKSEEASSDICNNNNNVATTTPEEDRRWCCNTEEEKDMANCLILLAQGQSLDSSSYPNNKGGQRITSPKEIKFTSRKFLETPNGSKAGHYVYECKTCFKTFPSFQALGGHRASHMRPKKDDEIARFSLAYEDNNNNNNNNNLRSCYSLALNLGQNKANLYRENELSLGSNINIGGGKRQRVHRCSTCGAEFSSGQALGGHMRRHRGAFGGGVGGASGGGLFSHCNIQQIDTSPTLSFTRLTRNVSVAMDGESLSTSMDGSKLSLDLDLNLPAPSEDDQSRVQLEANKQEEEEEGRKQSPPVPPPPPPPMQQQEKLVLTPPSLVDCHN